MTSRICPLCRKAAPDPGYAPFCSRRCADVDLQRWFAGSYAVPAVDQSADGEFPEGEAEP